MDLGKTFGVSAHLANPRVSGSTHTAASGQAWGREKETRILVSLQPVPKIWTFWKPHPVPKSLWKPWQPYLQSGGRRGSEVSQGMSEGGEKQTEGMENTLCDPNHSSQALAVLPDCGQPASTGL